MRVTKTVSVQLTKADVIYAVTEYMRKKGIEVNIKSVQFGGSVENPNMRFDGEEIPMPVEESETKRRKKGGE